MFGMNNALATDKEGKHNHLLGKSCNQGELKEESQETDFHNKTGNGKLNKVLY